MPTVFLATLASVLFLIATVCLLGVAFLGAGCAFTERVVNRQLLKTPEMRFEDTYTDRDRDLLDVTGLAGGAGGGGGGGGC